MNGRMGLVPPRRIGTSPASEPKVRSVRISTPRQPVNGSSSPLDNGLLGPRTMDRRRGRGGRGRSGGRERAVGDAFRRAGPRRPERRATGSVRGGCVPRRFPAPGRPLRLPYLWRSLASCGPWQGSPCGRFRPRRDESGAGEILPPRARPRTQGLTLGAGGMASPPCPWLPSERQPAARGGAEQRPAPRVVPHGVGWGKWFRVPIPGRWGARH